LTIGDVDLIANRIYSQRGWVGAHLKSSILTQIDEIEDCDCIGAAVADVCKLSITVRNVREATAATAGYTDQKRCDDSATKKKTVVRGGHCWEFISESVWESVQAAWRQQG
jgi:hypothetical protein